MMSKGTFELGPSVSAGVLPGKCRAKLRIAVGMQGDNLVIEFPNHVKWAALAPEQALELAALITAKVGAAAGFTEQELSGEEELDKDALLNPLYSHYSDRAAEAHEKLLNAESVTALAAYAAMEQAWHRAILELYRVFEVEEEEEESELDFDGMSIPAEALEQSDDIEEIKVDPPYVEET